MALELAIGLLIGVPRSASATERELNEASPPVSAESIQSPIERALPPDAADEESPPFSWLSEKLEDLPPFFADTQLEARFRTYYFRKDRLSPSLDEAWAIGGSLYYRSGWLADMFAVEVEGFTSQPLYAPQDRDGTLLLGRVQDGYSALGIANASLRYRGIELTGYRQYLELPFLNRNDSRMTPNTYEALTLSRKEGALRFSTGYVWKIKQRNSKDFSSMSRAIGLPRDRGVAFFGLVWDPTENLHVGAIAGVLPDVVASLYAELGFVRTRFFRDLETRVDTQLAYQEAIGDDLLGTGYDEAWNLAVRSSTSYEGILFRLGVSITGSRAPILALWGGSPSYVDLMQQTFTRADEKALLVSVSYDFAHLGVEGLSAITNIVAAFDGEVGDETGDAQEVDLTIDYRFREGAFRNLWLRVRGSWLHDDRLDRDSTEIRVILRYDFSFL